MNFYEGLTLKAQEALDYSAGGLVQLMKTAEEAPSLIDTVANNQYFYAHQRQRQPAPKRGVLELEGVDTILAQNKVMHQQIQKQMEMMAKRIDSLQLAVVSTKSQPSSVWGQQEEGYEESGRTLEGEKVDSKKEVATEDKDQEESKEEESQVSKKGKQVIEEQPQLQKNEVKPYTPPLPYPQRLQKELKDQQFSKFLEVFKKLEINIPLAEALEQRPLYAKFLKELINKKRSWNEKETVILTQECSAVIQKGLPPKLKDPGSFIISCTIDNMTLEKALYDLSASINLMPLSLMKKLAIEEVKPTRMSLQMADRSLKIPNGVVENLLVKIGEFIFPADFVILYMEEEGHKSIILG
ncbi:uncharacterized protein LOC130957309 [Arachis stenosperma]|uniref:uncharacterized protein LOC130957309 n=1 Tax=Arachis stenosperma TaxID=217475 RepID=UPI0025ACBE76|nr:uncharacterized protein LOC130957309 [Arachis stenosperma]